MKEHGLRKLSSGQIMIVDHTRVPRIIGKSGSMISILKENTGCRIFIGQNGIIWLDGELAGIVKASRAIKFIDHNSQMHGLTDKIRELLGVHETDPDGQMKDPEGSGQSRTSTDDPTKDSGSGDVALPSSDAEYQVF